MTVPRGAAGPDLTAGQRRALSGLARKQQGEAVPFVNIADARALSDLGLAARGRVGWEITAAGAAFLANPGALRA